MDKNDAFRLLIGSGFTVCSVDPKPNYHLFTVERTELLGTLIRYRVAITATKFTQADVKWLSREASQSAGNLVLVGECDCVAPGIPGLTSEQFADRLGGPILSLLPLDPAYPSRLAMLGQNRLPALLKGDTSDLFEEYVHAGFQFLFGTRVIRYGQDRRFENVADGVSVGDGIPLVLHDAKAYAGGYEVTSNSIRQFADYVTSFHKKYERRVGRIASFLVVSGQFKNKDRSMEGKSRALRGATSGVGLCFVTAESLGKIVRLLVEQPLSRGSLDWTSILMKVKLEIDDICAELSAIQRDGILTR